MSGVGERRQLCWLDLCSGLGGASQPALRQGMARYPRGYRRAIQA